MRHLETYVERKNIMRNLFGKEPYDIKNLSQKDCDSIVDSLGADLSPENLTCDGELRGSELQARYNHLQGVLHDLTGYTVRKGYILKQVDY